jgi:hypothetical protein
MACTSSSESGVLKVNSSDEPGSVVVLVLVVEVLLVVVELVEEVELTVTVEEVVVTTRSPLQPDPSAARARAEVRATVESRFDVLLVFRDVVALFFMSFSRLPYTCTRGRRGPMSPTIIDQQEMAALPVFLPCGP